MWCKLYALQLALWCAAMVCWYLQVQREGTDVTLVGYGKMVGYNLKAAEQLEKEGISCEVSQQPVSIVKTPLHCLLAMFHAMVA